jgi:hypothetical protein
MDVVSSHVEKTCDPARICTNQGRGCQSYYSLNPKGLIGQVTLLFATI